MIAMLEVSVDWADESGAVGLSTGTLVLRICEGEIRQFLLDADMDGFLLLVD